VPSPNPGSSNDSEEEDADPGLDSGDDTSTPSAEVTVTDESDNAEVTATDESDSAETPSFGGGAGGSTSLGLLLMLSIAGIWRRKR
jgi:hypothetical protein